MSIKCILFDNDGVIVKSEEMFSQKLSRENNIPAEDIVPFFKDIFVPKCMVGTADLKQELVSWLPRWKWKGTAEDLLQYWFQSEHNIDFQVAEYVRTVRDKGILCFLVTNQDKYRTKYLREEMGFGQLFDGVFSSAELGYKKPSLEFYEKVFNAIKKKTEVAKKEILYVDDEERNIEAGKQFGFQVLHYTIFDDLKLVDTSSA